jgi:hypothetical protein
VRRRQTGSLNTDPKPCDWDFLIVERSIVETVRPDVGVKNLIDVPRGKGRAAN